MVLGNEIIEAIGLTKRITAIRTEVDIRQVAWPRLVLQPLVVTDAVATQ